METKSSYRNLSTLLDNELFFEWIINPTPELDAHWEKLMGEDEDIKRNIIALKKILKKIRVVEPSPESQDKAHIWEKMEKEILALKRKKRILRMSWIRIAAAAAAVVLIVGGYWLFDSHIKSVDEIDYHSFAATDKQMTSSNNIRLILPDNRKIDIDKDSETIDYSNKGEIKIGSEQVAGNTEPSELNQLIVPYGKIASLILSDGSKIWVNSGSQLLYPSVFEENKREVFLTGEAYLDVTKNEKAKFVIKTNHIDINVLGTKLNISAYSDDPQQSIILVTGSVEVKSKEMNEPIRILPDQMLTYGRLNKKIDIQIVDVANYTSWIDGYLLLENEDLGNLLQKLERHYNLLFIYNREELKNIYVSGKLNLEVTVQEVLDCISITTPIVYSVENDPLQIKIKRKP